MINILHFVVILTWLLLSSGQQSQNPLLLLGQYSDDEMDEGSSKGPNDSEVHSHEEVFDILPKYIF